ncbi:hypothetical protein ACH42_17265 [Endozoicomonas sp. (ex Bugula neritina AB1)]|nr:hypothetical protein ACH42_17265 [Endozoicomonas sp. (ex Bugula neritina AB1)]
MTTEPEIVELIGKDKTLLLERTLGGQRKYIASQPTSESSIVAIIGMDAAQELAARFGGMLLYIPQSLAARERNQEIHLAVWAGEHKQIIGHRFGLVERTIRKIVQGDNWPRYGMSCRHIRAQVQGYRYDRQRRQDQSRRKRTGCA